MKDLPVWAARIRAERRRNLWTQREMAKQLADAADEHTRARLPTRESLTRNIKDWEAGKHRPKDPYPMLYSRVFAMEEHQLFDNGGALPRRTPAEILNELLREESPLAPIANRTGRSIGRETVTDLSARVHSLRLADDLIAGKDLIQPAFRELDAAVRIYREGNYREDVGKGLLVAIGEFAQIAGWVASDAGQHAEAARTYRLGISAAVEAGDGTLASNLIGSLAYQTSNSGDPTQGIALAYTALEAAGPHNSPRARALAWDRVAWAHVRAGEAQAAMRALGEADTALTNPGSENEPTYLYWVNAAELQIMSARAYTELRRPLRAVPLLTDVLSRYNATHSRELALYLSWLAVALTDANEPEEAAQAAERMLNLSADVASDRTTQRAKIVRSRLETYRDLPQVRELLHDRRWDR